MTTADQVTTLPPAPPPAKDIGPVPASLDAGLAGFLGDLREAVQELQGHIGTGARYNAAVRRIDLIAKGFLDQSLNPLVLPGSGGAGPPGVAGPPGASGTITPDPTPPPQPTGLSAVAGLTTVIVSWTAAVYTQGHGPGQVNVYAVKKDPSDLTMPTFGDASIVIAAPNPLTLIDLASDTNIRWHIWIKFQSNDGFESATPAGGTNGVQVTTGKIGNTDLNNLIITADKLAAGTYPNINLVPNGNAEDALSAWYTDVTGAATFTASAVSVRGGSKAFRLNRSGTDYAKALSTAFPVIPGETYSVKVAAHTNVATTAGVYIRMYEKATRPPLNYVHDTTLDSFTDLQANGPGTTAWSPLEFQYTVPAGIFWVSFVVLHYTSSTAADLYFDDVSVGRQITASFLAAGSIAVGSAAIQNAAIVGAMIALATITDANVANLSASKLTVGSGVVGGPLKSTNYSAGSAGWIVLPNGFAEFNDVDIRGATYTGSIFAGSGTIGGIVINAHNLRSSGYAAGTTGFSINDDGTAEFQNLTARGNITANALNAAIGTIGTVVADATGIYSANYVTLTSGWKLKPDGTGELQGVKVRGDVQATSLNAATGTFAGALTAAALAVAGHSIFSPVVAQASSATTPSTSAWTTILTAASVDPGATGSVAIVLSLMSQAAMFSGATGGEGDSSTYEPISYRVQRNGLTIYSFNGQDGYSRPLNVSDVVLETPGGAAVYTLQEKAPTTTVGGGTTRRSMLVMGITR